MNDPITIEELNMELQPIVQALDNAANLQTIIICVLGVIVGLLVVKALLDRF